MSTIIPEDLKDRVAAMRPDLFPEAEPEPTVGSVTVLTLQFPMDIERAAQTLNALSAIYPGAKLDGPTGGLIVSVVELRP